MDTPPVAHSFQQELQGGPKICSQHGLWLSYGYVVCSKAPEQPNPEIEQPTKHCTDKNNEIKGKFDQNVYPHP